MCIYPKIPSSYEICHTADMLTLIQKKQRQLFGLILECSQYKTWDSNNSKANLPQNSHTQSPTAPQLMFSRVWEIRIQCEGYRKDHKRVFSLNVDPLTQCTFIESKNALSWTSEWWVVTKVWTTIYKECCGLFILEICGGPSSGSPTIVINWHFYMTRQRILGRLQWFYYVYLVWNIHKNSE